MFQYAKEKLTKKLEEKNRIRLQKEQELKEIEEKLESICSYDDLKSNQAIYYIIGLSIGIIGLFNLITNVGEAFFVGGLSLGDICPIIFSIIIIKNIRSNAKEIKVLKQQGVKRFIKEETKLRDKKLALEKECNNIQERIDKIVEVLENINFSEKSVSDPFFQADTEEEYGNYKAIFETEEKGEQLFQNYLDEKIDYENVHLNVDQIDGGYVRILKK